MGRIYDTRDEAIERAIIPAIEAGDAMREEFDIEAIANELIQQCIRYDEDGVQLGDVQYVVNADDDEFWATVWAHML